TDAGIILLPEESTDQYGPALVRVLTNDEYRASLAERNRKVQIQYFSWRAIAAEYASALRK
ncbi:MAG: hypothetical protein M3N22_11580, partial [Acidobacteriota bacterium]|nr:hypothetical protein [Acidobacteriota bacterium]